MDNYELKEFFSILSIRHRIGLLIGFFISFFFSKRSCSVPRLNEDTNIEVTPDPDAITTNDDLLFREVCHGLKDDMQRATSKAEIESYYWEIEHTEDDYRGKVSDNLLRLYIVWLYQIQAQERDRIAGSNAPKFALG